MDLSIEIPLPMSMGITVERIPAFTGTPYFVLNDNNPCFSDRDLSDTPFQYYSELDSLGRCGVAFALVCPASMPDDRRGKTKSILPTGFLQAEYDIIEGGNLYNRCHLMAYQLTGQNDNIKNLITGTHFMNAKGMRLFENKIAHYIKETRDSVLYRITPVFKGEELVARGVQMEALAIEDGSKGVCFNVFCYNAQPGVEIDYLTGASWQEVFRDKE